MKVSSFKKSTLALAVSAATVMASNAIAADDAILEEVIVTATARAQSTQEIPFNISAFQGSDIAAQNIVDSAELMRSIAGVSMVDRGHRNGGTVNSIIIRGMNVDGGSDGDIGLSAVPTVSTYVDSTPLFANFILKDIERVEVLRGPQATLYGSGALGGTVRYIMNKPSTEAVEGGIDVGYSQSKNSSGNNKNTDVVINIPLSDTVAVRFSGGMVDNAGVIDQPNAYQMDANGVPVVEADDGSCLSVSNPSLTVSEISNNGSCYTNVEDADTVEIDYVRAGLLFQPSEDLEFLLTYQRQKDEIGGRRSVTVGNDYFGNAYGEDENGSALLEPSERTAELFSLAIEADLGFATLTSNTSSYEHKGSGWRDNTSLWVTDRSAFGKYSNWYHNWYNGMPRPASHVEAGFRDEAIVQEFRLVSNTGDGDKIDWLAGVYYMDQEKDSNNFSHLRGLEEYGLAVGGWWAGWGVHDMDMTYQREEKITDKAVYGEMTYHITDDVRVTGGLRWFDNEIKNQTAIDAYYGQAAVIPFVEYPTQSESDVLSKLNLSWDVSESTMLYATYSEGFRRGGSNAIPTNGTFQELNPETVELFEKDTVKNYEIGIKGVTDRVRYSADIYMVDWKAPQLNTSTAWWGFFMAQNGDSARSEGVELEAQIAVTENLNMNLGYSYTKAELTGDVIQPQNGALVAPSGNRLPGVPKQVMSVSLDHTMSLSDDMDIVSRVSGYYQSDTTNSIASDSYLSATYESFSIWNASVALNTEHWKASLFVKNIANELGTTGGYPETYWGTDTGVFENYYGNNQKNYMSSPRTIGVSLGYKF